MEDQAIVQLYWDRKEEAITQTQEKYQHYCYKIAWNVLENQMDSEECVNDTYLKAWNSMPDQRPDLLKAFLGTITRNLSLDRYRQIHSKKRGGGNYEAVLDDLTDCMTQDGPEQQLEITMLTELLNQFLESLDPETRRIFVRRYWYMDPMKEIATRMDISEGKVKTVLYRTRRKMAGFLQKEGVTL